MKSTILHTQGDSLEPLSDSQVHLLVDNHRRFQEFLSKRVPDPTLAEDILQQAIKKAVERPPTAENDRGILAWFYQVLRTTLADYYRSQASEESKAEAFHQELSVRGEDLVPARDDLEAAICKCLNELLPTLRPGYSELIRRIDLEGETVEHVAQDLGISAGNMHVRLHRARQSLKTSLERACGTCTEHGCLDCTCG